MGKYKDRVIATGYDPFGWYSQGKRCPRCGTLIKDASHMCGSCAKKCDVARQKYREGKRWIARGCKGGAELIAEGCRIGYYQDLIREK